MSPRSGLATTGFLDTFALSRVIHMAGHGSDHAVLRILIEEEELNQKKKFIFRFEEVWAKDDRCEGWIRHLWKEPARSLSHKLSGIQKLKHSFKDLRTGKVTEEIKRIDTLLNDESCWSEEAEGIQKFKSLERQRNKLLKIEETMWRQRSRALWLKDSDRNTKFFHGKVFT